MKLRHLILFFMACMILIVSRFPGGSLLGLFAWLQINTLITQSQFSKKSQLWATYLFFISVPLILFWGSCHSFLFIYLAEKSWTFFIMIVLVNLMLCCIASVYFILSFRTAEKVDYRILASLELALKSIKDNRPSISKNSCLLFIMSFVPFLPADWKIVFAIMATHLILHRHHVKRAFDLGF